MVFVVLSSVCCVFVDFVAIVFVSLSVFCIGFASFMWWVDAGCSKVFASEFASESIRRTPGSSYSLAAHEHDSYSLLGSCWFLSKFK